MARAMTLEVKFRRPLLWALAALLALPLRAAAEPPPIPVGVILPLSGANAQFGINSRNGIELVVDEINAAGGIKSLGGAKIKLMVADSTSTPTTAATVAQRFITQNEVVAILGAFASSLTIAISEVTERREIPLLTMSFADTLTERGFKNLFQVVSKGSVLGRAQFDYTLAIAQAAGEKIERVAIMYEDTAYGTAQANGLRAAAKAAGVAVVMDATPLINKLRASGAQVAFPVSYLNDSLLIIRAMRQQNLDTPAIGGAAGYVIPDFAKGLGDLADGTFSINPSNYDLSPAFTERFRKRYGYFMVHEALEHAVAMQVLVTAMERAASRSPADIRAKLAEGSFTEGWAQAMTGGSVKFDAKGLNVLAQPVMVQWRDGELVTVWPAALAKGKPAWRKRK
jgi:branched-chain amino acid transport system substrate-binding protein